MEFGCFRFWLSCACVRNFRVSGVVVLSSVVRVCVCVFRVLMWGLLVCGGVCVCVESVRVLV